MRHASATCQVHSHCELSKPATSVYIACKQLRHHQPVVCTRARSKDFHIRVVWHYFIRECSSSLNQAVRYNLLLLTISVLMTIQPGCKRSAKQVRSLAAADLYHSLHGVFTV